MRVVALSPEHEVFPGVSVIGATPYLETDGEKNPQAESFNAFSC